MTTPELLTQLADRLAKHQVVGESIEHNGVVVIPVMNVRAGGGLGSRTSDSGNGGLGIITGPVGAWVVKDGKVTWQPALDLNRVILGGQAVALVGLLVVYRLLRRRRAGSA